MMKRIAFIVFLLLLVFALPASSFAHGVRIGYKVATTIEVTASYDDGRPMAGGQVAIYAPDDPSKPWLTGTCDENGKFTFTPDPAKPGTWDVQVRQAGHGDILHIPIGEGKGAMAGSTGYTPLQIALMSACVVWGFLGTALFFSRREVNPEKGRKD
ncbi:MAG: carboxypeptidase regulatory-like domain-containing protein [Anaerolineae bacterium]